MEEYRQLFITFSNDKTVSCIVQNNLTDDEIKQGLTIKSIKISETKEMPHDTYFGNLTCL